MLGMRILSFRLETSNKSLKKIDKHKILIFLIYKNSNKGSKEKKNCYNFIQPSSELVLIYITDKGASDRKEVHAPPTQQCVLWPVHNLRYFTTLIRRKCRQKTKPLCTWLPVLVSLRPEKYPYEGRTGKQPSKNLSILKRRFKIFTILIRARIIIVLHTVIANSFVERCFY